MLRQGVDDWAPAVDSEFAEWVNRHAVGDGAQAGSRRVAGLLDAPVLQALQAAGAGPAHATLAMDAGTLATLLGGPEQQAGQAALVEQLPPLLRRVGEAWLDRKARRVVMLCTPSDMPRQAVQVTVQLDVPLRQDVGNAVTEVRVVDPRTPPAGDLVPLTGQR